MDLPGASFFALSRSWQRTSRAEAAQKCGGSATLLTWTHRRNKLQYKKRVENGSEKKEEKKNYQ